MVKIIRYLPKSEVAVHRILQLFAEKHLFMSIFFNKVAGPSLENNSGRNVYLWVCVIFQSHFFANHVWVVTASAKYHFLCCVDFISKMLFSTLVMFWLSLNILRANTGNRFWTAVSGRPRKLIDLLLIKQAIPLKCC